MSHTYRRNSKDMIRLCVGTIDDVDIFDLKRHNTNDTSRCYQKMVRWFTSDRRNGHGASWYFRHTYYVKKDRRYAKSSIYHALTNDTLDSYLNSSGLKGATGQWLWMCY